MTTKVTPRTKRFDLATVKDATKLAAQLNQLVTDLTKTSSESYRDFTLQVKTPIEDSFPFNLAHGMSTVPKGLEVASAVDKTDGSVFTTPPFASFIPDRTGKNLIIQHITGLQAGHTYSFRFRVSV